MNERILELAIEARKYAETKPDIYQVAYDKRFAELLIQECINVIGEENYTMLTGKAYCTELKRHFGVKSERTIQ